ncbi:MAG: hypothetical protein BGO10_03270 [Chlamydia sp. 32-24]|nr:MAG: hypothetical protein BGO10_03270 [Chlamydia sp. 32-24]
MSAYHYLLKKLFSLNLFGGVKLGLKNPLLLNDLCQNPLKDLKIIHVAGTNGKGSVCTKIAKALEYDGYKTGLFTSPHISTFRERIQINGHMISESEVESHLNKLFSLIEENQITATFFEVTFILALLHFAFHKVDYVVLETGLGGRLDATNISKPILTIITSIGKDHCEILGNTIEEITLEKAGIIKENTPIIIGKNVSSAIITPIAKKYNAPLQQVQGSFRTYLEENNATAQLAMKHLPLTREAISHGLMAMPLCRLQKISSNLYPLATFILDVGHNPDGIKALFDALKNKYPDQSYHLIVGLSKNKDIDQILELIAKENINVYFVEAKNGRGASRLELKTKFFQKHGKIGYEYSSIDEAIKQAYSFAKEKELIVICGTFFIMSEAKNALGIICEEDYIDLNERFTPSN